MAFEITIPTAILPTQPGVAVTGPVAEQDVPLDSKPTKNKKAVRQKPDRAYSGIPLMVSNGRSPQPIEGLPVQKAWPGEGTGVSYKGPFVPDDGVSTETNTVDGDDTPVFSLPTNELRVAPGEDTFLSKMIRPDEDELEAARNGMRWHWALEHRFMPPGSKWNETVWNGVDRENRWLANMLKTKGGGLTDKVTSPIASARERAVMTNMWKQFLKDLQNGHFDAYGGTSEAAMKWADSFKQHYEERFGKGSSAELAPIPEVLGKRSDVMRKQNFDIREAMNYTEDAIDNIYTWVNDGSFKDPFKQGIIKNYLDKMAQSLAARLGGDSKSMADAEKVRIQILSLPEESMKMVQQEIANYRDFLESVMEYGRAKGWSQNIIGKINRGKEGLDMAARANGKGNISTLAGEAMSAVGNVLPSLTPSERELAVGLSEALEAGKEAHKTYMYNMTLAADVDPAFVYELARTLHGLYSKQYDKEMEAAKRPERATPIKDLGVDLSQLARLVKPSPLLKPTNYRNLLVEMSRAERAGGNPMDVIEQRGGSTIDKPSKPKAAKSIDVTVDDIVR